MRTDAEKIFERAVRGDGEALGELLVQFRPVLWPICYRGMSGKAVDAEDVLQETFFRALRGFHGYDPSRPIEKWLKGIAVRVVADHYRGLKKHARDEQFEDHERQKLYGRYAPAEHGTSEWLSQVLEELDPVTRTVMVLRYMDECSWDEIGEVTGLSREAVKKRLLRGKQRLRDRVDATGEKIK